jgi:[acyl-carrier-protein] S-malonyltransferase
LFFFIIQTAFISLQALKFIKSNAEQYKLRRLKILPVSGAFHTSLMRPAVEPFKEALKKVDIVDPIVPVFSNVDGKSYKNAYHIKVQLPKQIYRPVKWEQTLHILYERSIGECFPRTFECGPGSSLKSLLKMVNAKAWDSCFSIEA